MIEGSRSCRVKRWRSLGRCCASIDKGEAREASRSSSAYAVTRAWLAERGLPDRHDDFAIFFASKCPDEIPANF